MNTSPQPGSIFYANFFKKVDKTPGHGPKGDCWLWTGMKDRDGYGRMRCKLLNQKNAIAHRLSYWIQNGYLPELLAHSCDFTSCVNPNHLEDKTQKENMQDASKRGRLFRKGRRLTIAQKEQLKAEYGILTMYELADKFGIHYTRVRQILKHVS